MHAGLFFVSSFGILVSILLVVGSWKTFQKAGQPGWAILIPIYNYLVALRIAGRPWWWILLLLIPLVNLVVHVVVNIDIAKSFGKGTGFGIGLWILPFIFFAILGFGESRFTGKAAA